MKIHLRSGQVLPDVSLFADLLEPLTVPERNAVFDCLDIWCQGRTATRSDVADMIDFHLGEIGLAKLVRRGDIAAQKERLHSYLG